MPLFLITERTTYNYCCPAWSQEVPWDVPGPLCAHCPSITPLPAGWFFYIFFFPPLCLFTNVTCVSIAVHFGPFLRRSQSRCSVVPQLRMHDWKRCLLRGVLNNAVFKYLVELFQSNTQAVVSTAGNVFMAEKLKCCCALPGGQEWDNFPCFGW